MGKLGVCVIAIALIITPVNSQSDKILDIKWYEASNIFITLENGSGYKVNVNELFHSNGKPLPDKEDIYTYYPVMLAENFINELKAKNITTDTVSYDETIHQKKYNTLWSAVHHTLGGGWAHFINTLLYSLESGQLDLKAPLLKRPESNWKPKPITESYKRTKNWDYYIPEKQRLAIKEYKIQEKNKTLGDIKLIPEGYIRLFLETSDKEYKQMKVSGDKKSLAKIDLIRLLLSAKYLGVPQIHYIKSMILKSVLKYSINNQLPSIIVFDDLQAAVSMKLDTYGYHIEEVAFKNEERLSETEYAEKMKLLNTIVSGINEVNKQLFQERLGNYYK